MKRNFRILVILSVASLFHGTISTAQEPAPYRLTLRDAIQKALQANLNVLVANPRVAEAAGPRPRRLSAALLPRVRMQSYANLQNRNLSAFGISLPGVPEVVGPFSNYDFRVYADQNIVDLQSYRGLKASERALDAGKMDYQDARDLIVRAVASLYLNAQSAAARVDAAQSRVTASDVLYKLAKDQHDAGTATGVDVLRSQVQLANNKQALLVAQNQYKQSLLARPRTRGMRRSPLWDPAEPLQYQPLTQPRAES